MAWWSRSQLRPWTLYGKRWGTWRTSQSRAVKPTRRKTRSSSTSSGQRTTTTSTRGETGRDETSWTGVKKESNGDALMSRTIELIASQTAAFTTLLLNLIMHARGSPQEESLSRVKWCGLTCLWETDQRNQFYSKLIKSANINVTFHYQLQLRPFSRFSITAFILSLYILCTVAYFSLISPDKFI